MYPNFPVDGKVSNDSKEIESNLELIGNQHKDFETIPVGRAFDLYSTL